MRVHVPLRLCLFLGLASLVSCMEPPIPPAPSPSSHLDHSKHEYEDAAVTGLKQKLGTYVLLEPDCNPMPPPTTIMLKMPLHGHLAVERGLDFPHYAGPDPRAVCNRQKREGTILYYTSALDYAGPDEFELVFIGKNGSFVDETYKIRVFSNPGSEALEKTGF
jgi:hypothetical protein